MPLEYKILDEAAKSGIKNYVQVTPAEPVYEDFLPAWEAEHYAHTLLLEKAKAKGDEAAVKASEDALAALEKSVTNVRAGKRPDGTTRPKPPAPPAPAPTPTPPAPPAPAR